MQRLEVQITQIEAEIKEVKEEAAKENDPAIKLEAMKQLTALRTHINEIEKQKTFLMQQEGESQLLALLIKSKISLPCMAKSSHAYPSRQFTVMSHFISFGPLIVPVSVPLPRCRLALDETF